jgi:biopolymer transport protein ExbD
MRLDGRLYLDEQLVTLPILEDRLKQRMQMVPARVAYLRADEGLRYGKVIEVVDAIKRAGVEQIGFVYILPQEAAARR